ncbi:MAG: glutathione S-transferase family protein [Caldimonas sp.]
MPQFSRHVTLFHSPQSRSTGVLALLEEIGADYDLHFLNAKNGEQRRHEYLSINPMGKVPAILHDGSLVTEQGAVYVYLADLYGDAELAPAIDDPLRGSYLRWFFFYGSSFEPAIVDRSMKRQAAPLSMSPYGDYETMFGTVQQQLAKGPFFLGANFTALDLLWGTALRWTTRFELVPESNVVGDYIERIVARPAVKRAESIDDELMKRCDDASRTHMAPGSAQGSSAPT